eukprot:scaffold409848_cov38-Prasinocladus_malaysianus.AAC.1
MVASNSEEVFARQIRYIQVQLSSTAPDHTGPDSGDEEEFEDIDEEGEDGADEVEDFEAEGALQELGRYTKWVSHIARPSVYADIMPLVYSSDVRAIMITCNLHRIGHRAGSGR